MKLTKPLSLLAAALLTSGCAGLADKKVGELPSFVGEKIKSLAASAGAGLTPGGAICTKNPDLVGNCLVELQVRQADGTARDEVGVYVGNNMIALPHNGAAKGADSAVYTVALSDGTTRPALPWTATPRAQGVVVVVME